MTLAETYPFVLVNFGRRNNKREFHLWLSESFLWGAQGHRGKRHIDFEISTRNTHLGGTW